MYPLYFCKTVLMNPAGFTSAAQALLLRLQKLAPGYKAVTVDALRQAGQSARLLQLKDIPGTEAYRQLLADIEGLAPPSPSLINGLNVPLNDYQQQGKLRYLKDGQLREISLEEAVNAHISGAPSFINGSNNSYVDAGQITVDFFKSLGYPEGIAHYLALDFTYWPTSGAIVQLTQKNTLVEAGLLLTNDAINTARQFNPVLETALGYTHSYGNFPRVAASTLFTGTDIPNARSTLLAPLGTDLNVLALNEAKACFKGRIAVVRPALDPIEMALTARQIAVLREPELLRMATDLRLDMTGHSMASITKALVEFLTANKLDVKALVDRYYTERPATVEMDYDASGLLETQFIERGGPQYTQEAYLKSMSDTLVKETEALNGAVETQSKLLQEALKYQPPTTELQETAASLKQASDLLSSATVDNRSNVNDQARGILDATAPVVNAQVQAATVKAQGNAEWSQSVDSLNKSLSEYDQAANEARDAREVIDEGAFHPEEI